MLYIGFFTISPPHQNHSKLKIKFKGKSIVFSYQRQTCILFDTLNGDAVYLLSKTGTFRTFNYLPSRREMTTRMRYISLL